jgi:hypothetical protein
MPILETKIFNLAKDRVNFVKELSEKEIEFIATNHEIKVLQTAELVDSNSWAIINELLLIKRPDLQIRVYGHYSQNFDLSFVQQLTNVRNLAIDCISDASNIEVLGALHNLETLSVGIYSLESFDFLYLLPISLTKLFLGNTKSKKSDLVGLKRFSNLVDLYIDGQQKNIEAIGELQALQKLVLRSVTPKDISFIRKLEKLWSLDIKLGGIKNLNFLEDLSNIKYLELWQIQGLSDISVISSLTGLQYLYLQSLRNVTTLPDMTKLKNLRRVYLETMKGLRDISGLLKAPALEEFAHVCARNMTPEQYQELFTVHTLKKARFGFGSDYKNEKVLELMKANGVEELTWTPFEFRQ